MSGGSYNYLFAKHVDNIFEEEGQLEAMVERLRELGYAESAALETEAILAEIRKFKEDVQKRINTISPVWRAVEYCDSGDSLESEIRSAALKFAIKEQIK